MHYNRYRYYSPELGRYISADPIGQRGTFNVYRYAQSNPLAFTDPVGLTPKPPGGVWTGGRPGQRQTRFPPPEVNKENCASAREILRERGDHLIEGYATDIVHGIPFGGSSASGVGRGGGIDVDRGAQQWIEPTGEPVRDWNRAEHESNHGTAADQGTLTDDNRVNELMEAIREKHRLEEFLERCCREGH